MSDKLAWRALPVNILSSSLARGIVRITCNRCNRLNAALPISDMEGSPRRKRNEHFGRRAKGAPEVDRMLWPPFGTGHRELRASGGWSDLLIGERSDASPKLGKRKSVSAI